MNMENKTIPGLAIAISALASINVAVPVIATFVINVITAWRAATGQTAPLKEYIDQLEEETDDNDVKIVGRIAGLREAIADEAGE
jgi:hypothetical protein